MAGLFRLGQLLKGKRGCYTITKEVQSFLLRKVDFMGCMENPRNDHHAKRASNSDGRPNKLDEIAWLVTELKGIIAQQGQVVETLKTSVGTNGESSTPPLAPTPASTKVDRKDPPLCVRISAAQASDPMDYGGSLTRYLPVEEVKARVTDALQKNTPTEGVEIIGVGTTKTGYIIRFRDEASEDTASVNEGWLRNLGNQTKLLARKGYKIEEIAWLKKRESTLGASASLGIWFDSAEAAEWATAQNATRQEQQSANREPISPAFNVNTKTTDFTTKRQQKRPTMEALLNDRKIGDLEVLLVQEPPFTYYTTPIQHTHWRVFQTSCTETHATGRSPIYVNKRVSTSAYRQRRCHSPDVTAIELQIGESQILIFSTYIPPFDPADNPIHQTLNEISRTIRLSPATMLIIAGDFNRHHQMWGGIQVNRRRARDTGSLLDFIQAQELHSCLPSGTATYWSASHPGTHSTLDLTLSNVPHQLLKCHPYQDNYGSDHLAIYSEWDLQLKQKDPSQPRRLFDQANWEEIGKAVEKANHIPWIESTAQLDAIVGRLITTTTAEIDKHTPHARPSPYAKRWFSRDLKIQQSECNGRRRRWQASCVERGSDHPTPKPYTWTRCGSAGNGLEQ
ncbi:predicted protein [Histoplasma mississippiense (nom. inval.)]|uniref:predicted protein n=1 Tax=Ajellomyces capsulatus (strain NAm1 / WU24) TaxID=2059318 RepID=UPI000157C701|nr:predicted protein [Histoplasma mississippiense (nom. inval.)]EDN08850.1 predicted protein [Histoplasma mississippiense (nom. inval.)]